MNLGDVHSQEDLQWKLEMERHRCAVLAMELRNRTRESTDLRRQLEEQQVYRQFQPLLVTLGIPFLPTHPAYSAAAPPLGQVSVSTVGSMPMMPPMTPVRVQEVRTCHDSAVAQSPLHFSASASQLPSPSHLHTSSTSQLHRANTPGMSSPLRHRPLGSSNSNEFLGSASSPLTTRSISASNRTPQRQLSSSLSTEHLGCGIGARSPSPRSRVFVRYGGSLRHAGSPPTKCVVNTSPRPSSTCRTHLRRSASLQTTLHAAPSRMVSVGSQSGPTGPLTTRESTGNKAGVSGMQQAFSSRTGSLSARVATPTARVAPSTMSPPPPAGSGFSKSVHGPCEATPLQPPVPMVPGGAADCVLAELRSELQRWVNSSVSKASVSTGGTGQIS